ncbi:tRNA (guanine-N1)-methyltransferase [Trichocoleus sp. FACHB-591]|uniref:tRNA (guanine-N1)-methyltransferase n=1 Tax=Trichocoleus sp. FACHB-591 TaxID=2692872 RepID=UPI0016842741|nr:tRNA (guanine-N1)-methyltransferase [Trichocoleus sp. FACHB-591]MBD2099059.1 tRNA (guanine-N1)-methyltransferase [Trichocoleus sp. FACHB-591]
MNQNSLWQQEGKVKFQIGNTFYRSQSQIGRDLGLLAAAIYKADTGKLRVLDVMTACGVRSLRYVLESQADWVWANDANPEVNITLSQNLASYLEPSSYQITYQDANRVFFDCYQRQDYYDLVDVDSFGSPAPHFSTSLWATKVGGLLYLTSTDGRTSSGHEPEKSMQVYGAYARWHPALHEQGLRLLLGSVLQQANNKGLSIQPIFSLFNGQVYRVMVRVLAHPSSELKHYGFLGYCHHCGHYETVSWRQLSRAVCHHHPASEPLTLSGPMWLGPLHDRPMLQRMDQLAQQWNWPERVQLLQTMQVEADLPPYFFGLGEIGRRGKMDPPPRDRLIQLLQAEGYQASPTHINAQAIKTNAAIAVCIELARQCQSATSPSS